MVKQMTTMTQAIGGRLRGTGAWSDGTRSEASGAGEHEPDAGEQHADELSRFERPCFRPQKAETVDERRRNRDVGEIENERLGRSEPGSNKGEARDDKR